MAKGKNCVLHGALNNTNFGDYLFGSIFYRVASEVRPGRVLFADMPKFGVCTQYREEMEYHAKCGLGGFLTADTLVYISGGYFGEMTSDFKNALKRYIRYFLIGRIAMCLKKKILVIGVGGGPLNKKFLRNAVCSILKYSKAVTFRDQVTFDYFSSFIDCSSFSVTSDTALCIDEGMIPPLDKSGYDEIKEVLECEKRLLVHIADHSETDELMERLIHPINVFLSQHPNYGVIFTYDGYENTPIVNQRIVQNIVNQHKAIYHYQGVWQLCSLITKVDCVITGKLHMGIVASRLGKSVLSFPYNSGKVKRFYEQIGESERCRALSEVQPDEVYYMLTKLADKYIHIPESVIEKAHQNIEVLQYELR